MNRDIINLYVNGHIMSSCDFLFLPPLSLSDRWGEQDKGEERDGERKRKEKEEEEQRGGLGGQ